MSPESLARELQIALLRIWRGGEYMLASVRDSLEAGADPTLKIAYGPSMLSACQVLALRTSALPDNLEAARLFDRYAPGCWEAAYADGNRLLPVAHLAAEAATSREWVPALAQAGLIDINRRSIHGTRALHHAAITGTEAAYGEFTAAGAVDCPIELSRQELALLRLRGLWVPEAPWYGKTAAELVAAPGIDLDELAAELGEGS